MPEANLSARKTRATTTTARSVKAPQPGDSIRAAIKKVSRGATTVSIIQAAMLLGIGRDAAYAAAESGALPTLKICARRWRVSTAVIERLLLGEDA